MNNKFFELKVIITLSNLILMMALSYLACILYLVVKEQKIQKFIIKEMFMISSLFKITLFLNHKVIQMHWSSIHSFKYLLNSYCMMSSLV